MKKNLLLLVVVCISLNIRAQDKNIVKQKFHFGIQQDTATGYTQAVLIDNVIYISGTVSIDVTPDGISRLYSNLGRTLQHYGATFQNVVKENLYTTDIEKMKRYNDTRKAFYKGDYPAATWVQINRLFEPQVKLEVELIAHLPRRP